MFFDPANPFQLEGGPKGVSCRGISIVLTTLPFNSAMCFFPVCADPKERKAVFAKNEEGSSANDGASAHLHNCSSPRRSGSPSDDSDLLELTDAKAALGEAPFAPPVNKLGLPACQLAHSGSSQNGLGEASDNQAPEARGLHGALRALPGEGGARELGDHGPWTETPVGTVGLGSVPPEAGLGTLEGPVFPGARSGESAGTNHVGNKLGGPELGDEERRPRAEAFWRIGSHLETSGERNSDAKQGSDAVHEEVVVEVEKVVGQPGRGMSVLPFVPVTLTFQDVCYFVDMPKVCKKVLKSVNFRRCLDLNSRQATCFFRRCLAVKCSAPLHD